MATLLLGDYQRQRVASRTTERSSPEAEKDTAPADPDFIESDRATSRGLNLEPDIDRIEWLKVESINVGGTELPLIETPVSEEGWVVTVEYFMSNLWASFPAVLARIVGRSDAVKEAFLEWESGVPVLQMVVDRSSPVAREAAYDVERRVGTAMPNVTLRYRLLDVSDVEAARRGGLRSLLLR